MKTFTTIASLLLVLLALTACGGGSGSTTTPAAKTTVSGIASKGPIINGVVKIYAVTNGAKGALLIQTTTDATGNYTADISPYTGPIMAEASGSYLDEATGTTKTISADTPIRAVLPSAQGAVSLPVTALTELAYIKTGGTLTPSAITAANTLISDLFKVDIIATVPVAPTAAALATATQAQKDYALALATISQMMLTGTATLGDTLATLAQGISTAGMTTGASDAIKGALTTFVTTNTNNTTGVKDTTSTNLVNAGTLTKSYKLVLQGTFTPGSVDGLQFDLSLPAGVTLNVDGATSAVLASSLTYSSTAFSGVAKYLSGMLTVGIITTSGMSAGEVATLICNIPAGAGAPAASAFSVTNLKSIDKNGVAVTGTAIVVQ